MTAASPIPSPYGGVRPEGGWAEIPGSVSLITPHGFALFMLI